MKLNDKIQTILKATYDSNARFMVMNRLGLCDSMPDDEYLKRQYRLRMGRELNLSEPRTFNEKLQWLKLYNRKPEYTMMVDKYAVKEYVAKTIGEEYIIPTLGVWDRFDDIDLSSLPNQFVLKCTHDSGGLIICKDKNRFNYKEAKIKIENSLKYNFYLMGREWPYKNVKPRIIAEKYMEDNPDSQDLIDYKLMCFNSKVKCSFTCTSRYAKDGLKVTFFDTNWNRMPFERHYPNEYKKISKLKTYEEMIKLAEKLAEKIPFVRIDFYEIKGNPYFGEMTFYPEGGMEEFTPEEWDETLGSWIELPNREGKLLFTRGGVILLRYIKRNELTDYKFFCFDGKVKMMFIATDRQNEREDTKFDFFDMNFNHMPFVQGHPNATRSLKKPMNFEKMKELAEVLSKDIPHVRVDFYEINGKVYFGEFTFFHFCGMEPIVPDSWDYKIGEWLHLPDKNK